MLYFANPTGPAARAAMRAGLLGFIDTPAQGAAYEPGVTWCADNGCYGKGWPGEDRWCEWLTVRSRDLGTCTFAVAPDVVGDASATLERSTPWLPWLRRAGYRAAFVAQDGLEELSVPWGAFDVLFIGGTTEWKEGEAARGLVREAVGRGLWVHMGRVNTRRRLRYAHAIGCASTDGTLLTYGTAIHLPRLLGWLRELHHDDLTADLFEGYHR